MPRVSSLLNTGAYCGRAYDPKPAREMSAHPSPIYVDRWNGAGWDSIEMTWNGTQYIPVASQEAH